MRRNGDYQEIEVTGQHKDSIVTFSSNYEEKTIVAIASCFLTKIINPGQLPLGMEVWSDTSLKLAGQDWHNLIDGQKIAGEIAIGKVLHNFPATLLID